MKYLFVFMVLLISQQDIIIEKAWIRNASAGMNTALFFDAVNNSDTDDVLIKAYSNAAEVVEIHETFEDGDMMGMREVKEVIIKANSMFSFKPMHHHVMLIKLKKDLNEGDKVDVTLTFKKAGEIKLSVPVEKMIMNKQMGRKKH